MSASSSSSAASSSFPYEEPGIVTILILTSFLYLGNAINHVLDHFVYCGLIGQIAIGVAWGTPGANWLSQNVQHAITQLGYLGLILIVYEGGLQTKIRTLKSNLLLSSTVAIIGTTAPIGLSFALLGFIDGITPLQCFAAGAALCSTSLGTTFTILSTSGLSQSRLGVVLSSAAMLDDIVGLVMSSIISHLGQSTEFEAPTVIRPVFVSIAFAVTVPTICLFLVKPATKLGRRVLTQKSDIWLYSLMITEEAALTFHVLVLLTLVTGASYAGTSNLFAAYLAGAAITWWDGICTELPQPTGSDTRPKETPGASTGETKTESKAHTSTTSDTPQKEEQLNNPQPATDTIDTIKPRGIAITPVDDAAVHQHESTHISLTGLAVFETLLQPALQAILKPFFFASIGFSIPITQMFTGSVLWRSLVYSILMIVAKLFCGLCLVRFNNPVQFSHPRRKASSLSSICTLLLRPFRPGKRQKQRQAKASPTRANQPHQQPIALSSIVPLEDSAPPKDSTPPPPPQQPVSQPQLPPKTSKPLSLYPACLLGSAMVARGEIGFLISAIAESEGIFSIGNSSELFLVVTWAILICTIVGPLSVGLMVRRVKRLQRGGERSGRENPLGIWGL